MYGNAWLHAEPSAATCTRRCSTGLGTTVDFGVANRTRQPVDLPGLRRHHLLDVLGRDVVLALLGDRLHAVMNWSVDAQPATCADEMLSPVPDFTALMYFAMSGWAAFFWSGGTKKMLA